MGAMASHLSSKREGRGIRVLSEEELHYVAGGDALGDAISCAAAIAAAVASANAIAGLSALGACINAIGSIPAPSVTDANCANNNPCVDGSVDGSDGNGSACGSSGCGSAGDGDGVD